MYPNELNHKHQQKKKIVTIKEGDNIVAVTFFVTKPQKKGGRRHFLAAKPS